MTIVVTGAADRAAPTVASALAQSEAALEVLLLRDAADASSRAADASAGDVGVSAGTDGANDDARVRRVAGVSGASQGAQLRAALEQARAPYVALVRAGDVLDPQYVARHVAAIETYPPATLTTCRASRPAPGASLEPAPAQDDGAASGRVADPAPTRGTLLRTLLARRSVPSGTIVVRRAAALGAGGFDATFDACAEEDLLLRLLPRCTVRVVDAPLITVAANRDEHGDDDAITLAARGRALVRLAAACAASDLAVTASDGIWRAPGETLLDLATTLAASPVPEAAALARRLLLEALRAGATLPEAATADALDALAPELVRIAAPPALQHGGGPSRGEPVHGRTTPADRAPAATFPPRVQIAIWSGSVAGEGTTLLEQAPALRARGIDLLLIGRAEDAATLDVWVERGVRVELLQWDDVPDEMAALLARCACGALLADPASRIAEVARDVGVTVLESLDGACAASDPAAALLRLVADAATREARSSDARASTAEDALRIERATTAALTIAADGLRDPRSLTGRPAARVLWSDQQRHDLAEIARDANAVSTGAQTVRLRASYVLDKLRLGHRFDQGVRAIRRRLQGVEVGGFAALDQGATEAFLARAGTESEWLWLIYATDPYSQTRGQRSMWIARDVARRGHRVIYLYWRWNRNDAIPASGEPNVLVVPIDQLPALQPWLLKLRAPSRRVLLIEFPDVALYERLNLFNAHGWTTVYDCVDEWSEFARVGQAGWYDGDVERHLARDSDVVIATHPILAGKLEEMSARTVPLVPNGVELTDLRPPDVPRTPHPPSPVIGYFGHLTDSWFDWDLIRATAVDHPDWRFEIYGYGQPEALALPENVVVPGLLPHAEIATRTAHWSAGIVPFREGRLTETVDPVKLYEYLALGLPVVAVGMPALRDLPGVVVCDRAGFDDALVHALATPLEHDRIAAFVASSTWQRRVDALLAQVEAADPARNAVKALAGALAS